MTIIQKKFNGIFTREIRDGLFARRQELGFTMQKAAHFCQVNVSTYRKWEAGPTKYCSGDKIQHLLNFLHFRSNYKYLNYNMHTDTFNISIRRSLPDGLYSELDQQFNIIHLYQNHRRFIEQYIQALNDFNTKQLKKFISHNHDKN